MIGLVILTHEQIGAELLKVAALIRGDKTKCNFVPIEMNIKADDLEKTTADALKEKTRDDLKEKISAYLTEKISAAVTAMDNGDGVLVLTDMLGGPPSEFSLSFLKDLKVKVIAGVNLPLLLHALELRDDSPKMTLEDLADEVAKVGRESISVPSKLIKKR
ncbi:MAG: hypothetical protein LBJ64_01515 [Deltaproteobacteria bacterium]|jgi:PTS system mannose-specific IIA component|nr:hypothetical protein [Deltaproteobacteria bacterium]